MSMSVIGASVLMLLLAGYLAQKYGLPPPAPKIAGIDLGTTYSSIGIYHAVSGNAEILPDLLGKRSIPSVVAWLPNGTILVGTHAVQQQEHNPLRTIYDAKRFIGRTFDAANPIFQSDKKRYPFEVKLDENGYAYFEIPLDTGNKAVYPEEVGSKIVSYLRNFAEQKLKTPLEQVVISVPAEFEEKQRNYTKRAAELSGMEVRRVISEPTAAALAYGLHKKKGVEDVVVVDLGGGTLDVSVLRLQGATFVTQAMAGNNRLGGQDFNDNVQKFLIKSLEEKFGKPIEDKEDIQQIRMEIEAAKLRLTTHLKSNIKLNLKVIGKYEQEITRKEFEDLNEHLFESIKEPIIAALEDARLEPASVDEIVLVGGSTRIPRIRKIVGQFFGKAPNFGVDPELAVATGASVQAGVIGGGWPLQVAAVELPTKIRKRHFYSEKQKQEETDF
ncbi:unnamed protein product, partial [Mesorhabditis belari]|uniref:Heat shock 70 kDa protein 13 n=1 Tax=Mesorhabditis belari TaxID=2138241 RepID=A0AAF3EFE6_9BILA